MSLSRFPSPIDVWSAFRQVAFTACADGLLYRHVMHSLIRQNGR